MLRPFLPNGLPEIAPVDRLTAFLAVVEVILLLRRAAAEGWNDRSAPAARTKRRLLANQAPLTHSERLARSTKQPRLSADIDDRSNTEISIHEQLARLCDLSAAVLKKLDWDDAAA